ncbi:Panacea domain-containing protein [Peptoniphilus obesi]|uniref:Panacea domain-containing protein n=1 Tax=Peptoniphilus obesi TaxID=1472765 RepID=UPI0004B5C68A|nr:type II toxin-antitoxin system antitoxin SocA domain-containing protein [Peptoniphilus obesi]
MYSIYDINVYIINYAFETNRSVTNLKLQKVLYFLYGFYYAITKKELFDENFEAWAYGPVVRKSYINYSMYGAEIIPPHNNYLDLLFDKNSKYSSESNVEYFNTIFEEKSKKTIDDILDLMLNISTMKLVDLSHDKGGPWYKSYEKGNKKAINKCLILNYFGSMSERTIE